MPRRRQFVLTIFAVVAMAANVHAGSYRNRHLAGGLDVSEARYESPDGRYCDATARVRERCQARGNCSVRAGNGLCGDPAKGVKKYLVIDYYCAGAYRQARIWEKKSKSLSCRNSAGATGWRTYDQNQARYPAGARGAIRILEARYGVAGGWSCDASFAARRACDGLSQCAVRAGNHLCGNPARGSRKQLTIRYQCLGNTEVSTVAEQHQAALSCPPRRRKTRLPWRNPDRHDDRPWRDAEGLHITDVTYRAPDGSYCDATLKVRQSCDGRQRCSVRAQNGLCGDPKRGVKKQLIVGFHCGGRRTEVRAGEGGIARAVCR